MRMRRLYRANAGFEPSDHKENAEQQIRSGKDQVRLVHSL